MKKKGILFLAGLICIGGLLSAEMGVDDLVNKTIEAYGGRKAFAAINTLKLTAKMHVQGMEVPIIASIKRPHFGRIEVNFQGMQIINGINEEYGWTINPMQGETEPKKMPEESYIRIKEDLEIDNDFIDYKKKGHTVELMGEDELDGAPVYKVKMVKKSGNEYTLFIDTEYFLVIKRKSKVKRGENEIESEELLGDYKEVAGIMIAHSTETKMNNATVQASTIEKVEVNLPMEDTLFYMPEKKEDPGAAEKK